MTDSLLASTENHLDELTEAVWAGRCVAFVGAGFSAAADLPGWLQLLEAAAREVPAHHSDARAIRASLDREDPSHRELEAVGQLIQDAVGPTRFRSAVSRALAVNDDLGLPPRYLRRRRLLREVPFQAILTTNFDPLLPGELPSPATYRRLLRADPGGPWARRYWPDGEGPDVLQLHGAVDSDRLVFARRDYRELLFGDSGYLTFLKALFATRTVLFMGFSFRDAYLDLLRAEMLSLVGRGEEEPPALAYAMMTDVSEAEVRYYRAHEGMRVLWFERTPDFAGMDALLARLRDATNPIRRLRARLADARVLWLDPHPENNQYANQLLTGKGDDCFEIVTTLEQARGRLRTGEWDLVLTHWGYREDGLSAAQELLQRMHAEAVRVPVVVFSEPGHAAENRVTALRWGAAELASTWTELFQAVERVLEGSGQRSADPSSSTAKATPS